MTQPVKRKRGRPPAPKCQLCAKRPKKGNRDGLCAEHEKRLALIMKREKEGRGRADPLPVKVKKKSGPKPRSNRTTPKAKRRKAA